VPRPSDYRTRSYLNVDYPYIGPRTLSRMRPEFRNTKELVDAMELARRIALSEKGRAAYGKVNLDSTSAIPGRRKGTEMTG
jgi:hypothetical protein